MIDFLIIGGTKCGSTSLADYVSKSERVNFCKQKEPAILNRKDFNEDYRKIYESLFAKKAGLKGEATPAYSDYGQVDTVIENLKRIGAKPKIILSVRNQVKRIESTYLQRIKVGKIKRDANNSIDVTVPGVLNRGMFGSVISKYSSAFSPESILIINFDLLIQENSVELMRLKKFLNLESELPNLLPVSNPSLGGTRKHWALKLYKKYLAEFWRRSNLPSLKALVPFFEKTSGKIEKHEVAKLTPDQIQFLHTHYKEDELIFKRISGWSYWDIVK